MSSLVISVDYLGHPMKTPPAGGVFDFHSVRIGSMEEQVEQNQHDCRHAHDPGQEIFTHDALLLVWCL
jgi:hypothetical protein